MLTKDAGDRDAKTVTERMKTSAVLLLAGGNNTGIASRGSKKRSETFTRPNY